LLKISSVRLRRFFKLELWTLSHLGREEDFAKVARIADGGDKMEVAAVETPSGKGGEAVKSSNEGEKTNDVVGSTEQSKQEEATGDALKETAATTAPASKIDKPKQWESSQASTKPAPKKVTYGDAPFTDAGKSQPFGTVPVGGRWSRLVYFFIESLWYIPIETTCPLIVIIASSCVDLLTIQSFLPLSLPSFSPPNTAFLIWFATNTPQYDCRHENRNSEMHRK
jgi:hypothetical protein